MADDPDHPRGRVQRRDPAGRRAETPAGAEHEDAVAGLQARELVERQPGGHAVRDHSRDGGKVGLLRHDDRHGVVGDRHLGVAAGTLGAPEVAEQCGNELALLEAVDAGPDRADAAGDLDAGHERPRQRERARPQEGVPTPA